MAVILVDYENVHGSYGLMGIEHLAARDTLHLFYSNTCKSIRAEWMKQIQQTGCTFRICKLQQTGKNALDFYICAACGEYIANGHHQIIIVSKDKGFSAVKDYVRVTAANTEIICTPNVEQGLARLSGDEEAARKKIIEKKIASLDLEEEFVHLEKYQSELRQMEADLLQNQLGSHSAEEVLCFLEQKKQYSKLELYRACLAQFGRNDGLKLYHLVTSGI